MEKGVPMARTRRTGPWSPPGIATPWPADEYLRDGGHLGPPVTTGNRGEVRGLQMEDTVAQFQTARRPDPRPAEQSRLSSTPPIRRRPPGGQP